jgi:hypothetical protein
MTIRDRATWKTLPMAGRSKHAALDSRAGFSECGRGTLLHKAVKKDGGSASNKTGNKACNKNPRILLLRFLAHLSQRHQSSLREPRDIVERKRIS